jgi:serine/threonine-protein kinase
MSDLILPTSSTGRLVQAGTAGERYRVVRERGRGELAVVYEARDEILDREVAIKVLRPAPTKRPDLVRRFVRESQVASQLQHPGIPVVHDLGWLPDGRPFLALKLMSGQTLSSLLATHPKDRERYLSIFEQLCQTMAYVHARRYVHRDLKPSQVMVGAFGEVQIVDWGLARSLDAVGEEEAASSGGALSLSGPTMLSDPDEVWGTPSYLAPERMRGEPGDARSDVYSLGAILSEILTGRPPVWSDRLILARLIPGGDGLETLRGCEADPLLIDLATRCLKEDPAARPAHAGELAQAVLAYREQVAERVRQAERERVYAQVRQTEQTRRRQILLASVSVIVLCISGLVGLMWHSASRAASQRQMVQQVTREALQRSEEALQRRDWARVIALLEPAVQQLADVTELAPMLEPLFGRLATARFALELEKLRCRHRHPTHEDMNNRRFVQPIERVFLRHGWNLQEHSSDLLATKLREHLALEEALDGLYYWYHLEDPGPKKEQLQRLLSLVEDDPWRQKYLRERAPLSLSTLQAVAHSLPDRPQPAELVLGIAHQLDEYPGGHGLAFRRAVQQRFPDNFWYNLELAAVLLRNQQYAESLRYAQVAVSLRPPEAVAWHCLGLAQLYLGQYEQAEKSLAQACERAPQVRALRLHSAQALYHLGRLDDSQHELEQAEMGEAPCAEGYYVRGLLADARRDKDQAQAALEQAWRLAPRGHPLREALLFRERPVVDETTLDLELALEPTAGLHFAKAKHLLRQGDDISALQHYRRAMKRAPEKAGIVLEAARLCYRLGDEPTGFDLVTQAVLLQPEVVPQVLTLPPFAYTARPPAGLDNLTVRLHHRYPDYPETALLRAVYHLQQREPERALQWCRVALKQNPFLSDALLVQGHVLERLGKREGAKCSYFLAHASNPQDARPLLALGCLQMQNQRYADAASVYRYIQRTLGESPAATWGLAESLLFQDKLQEANATILAALHHARDDSRLWSLLGLVAWRRGKFDEAERYLGHAVALQPSNIQARLNLGQVRISQNRIEQGLALLRDACRRAPEDAKALLLLGSALARQNRLVEADRALRRAVELDPRNPQGTVEWVAVLARLNRSQEAERLLQGATQHHPHHAQLLCLHGQMLLRLHRYQQAAVRLEQARKLLPEDSPNRNNLSEQIKFAYHLVAVETRLDAYLQGKIRPAPAEMLDLIDLYARARKKDVEAALWGIRLVEQNPQWGENSQRHLFLRLGAVALRAAEADPQNALRWRRQALTWLDRERRICQTLATQSALLPEDYRQWQLRFLRQPEVARMQNEANLKKLPREEAAVWRKLLRWTGEGFPKQ